MILPHLFNRKAFFTEARPYWGPNHDRVGGPYQRTRNMIRSFEHYEIKKCNLVYAGSFWSQEEFDFANRVAKKRKLPVVFNQNGMFFPAWYSGDWKQENHKLIEMQKASDFVIYQSEFCKESFIELTGYEHPNSRVLHNSTPIQWDEVGTKQCGFSKIILWLSGLFSEKSEHILKPVTEAVKIVREERGLDVRLKLAGRISDKCKKSEWFKILQGDIETLKKEKVWIELGTYDHKELSEYLKDVTVALHLQDKDACPNAVLERMACGLPHIFIKSGGTPELVGDCGIGLDVEKSWEAYYGVSPEQLADTIEKLPEMDTRHIGIRAKERVMNQFSWDKYQNQHRDLFKELLKDKL